MIRLALSEDHTIVRWACAKLSARPTISKSLERPVPRRKRSPWSKTSNQTFFYSTSPCPTALGSTCSL